MKEKVKAALELFVDKEAIKDVFHEPHTENGLTYAADGRTLIVFHSDKLGEYTEQPLGVRKIMSVRNCDILSFSLSKLQKEIDKLPKVPEMRTVGCPCPECNDTGVVEWEYTDSKGDTHYQDFECPICDGCGMTEEVETGNMIVDEETTVGIYGLTVKAEFILRLEKAMSILGAEKADVVHLSEGKIIIFKLAEDVFVGIMPMLTNAKVTMKL